MDMQRAVLCRLVESEKQTLGHFTLFQGTEEIFSCKTLELPWLDNQTDISCIPKGRYKCVKYYSEKYGPAVKVLELDGKEVSGREGIRIHYGNYFYNTLGCPLFGRYHKDINGDDAPDVTHSKMTMRMLDRVADNVFYLDVV